MAVFKCKMCSGELEITEGITVVECEYCGTKQTVPTAKDENLHPLFNRANTLRIKGEFDKAEKIYEKIIGADETQAEAYWGLILCKYGIEYVEDPATFKRVPTCHRASFDSIVADDDYKTALKYADGVQRRVYEAEAVEIDRIQKEILALSQKEEPYDVFICYKETDETGRRTQDSVIANDIYHQLTQEGFKVFYAAITLENKLGSAYEPCIFAALNSAKVMLAIGTKPEYFNAVWVKNEWSRYLKLIKTDRSRILIPCYRDMDAYELPEEFSHLQAQDMNKIGFINDVVRGIKKVIIKDEPIAIKTETVITESAIGNVAPLLERAFMFLEDGDFSSANEYCEKVLDIDPKCAMAYLGKLMAELKVQKQDKLKNCEEPFDTNNNYQKILRFGDDALNNTLTGYIEYINTRNENTRLSGIYNSAISKMNAAKTEEAYKGAATVFKSIVNYKNSAQLVEECLEKAENARKDAVLDKAKGLMKSFVINNVENAINLLETIAGWKDADALVVACQERIEKLKEDNERAKIAIAQRKKKIKKIAMIGAIVVTMIIVALIVFKTVIQPPINYENAKAAFQTENYAEAAIAFGKLGDYKDAKVNSQAAWNMIVDKQTYAKNEYLEAEIQADGTVKLSVLKEATYAPVDYGVVYTWKNIASIFLIYDGVYGLKTDGTVVYADNNYRNVLSKIDTWTDIVYITEYINGIIGIRNDGTLVAGGYLNFYDLVVEDLLPRKIAGWKNIVEIEVTKGYKIYSDNGNSFQDYILTAKTKDGESYSISRKSFS